MQFHNVDRDIPQQVHIYWSMITERDDSGDKPDERDEGFWPSRDEDAAGYVLPEQFDEEQRKAEERMEAWLNDEWEFIGVMAKGTIYIPIGGKSFRVMELQSAGLWGIESDADDSYIESVFQEERDGLMDELKTLGVALAEGKAVHCEP